MADEETTPPLNAEAEKEEPTPNQDVDEKIDKLNAAAERAEAATSELRKAQAEAKAEKVLAGNADIGVKKEPETPEEYSKRVMANDV